ncbi:hypothetical protein [Streptomyces aureoversilis]|uniref:Uncharacterized protein n=1 Tax=Streptomyces aureoversilis TaxID=67277 RepID=A0ABV9ZS92_9ACTN
MTDTNPAAVLRAAADLARFSPAARDARHCLCWRFVNSRTVATLT